MAENVEEQVVVRVNVDESIKSVRELRKAIADEKDALVAMTTQQKKTDEAQEQYDKTVESLQRHTEQLNTVMAASKKTNTAVAGSYYDLNAQLIEARKKWKNLTEEQRDAEAQLGDKGLLGKIQRLDTQLKNMDAQIGQHQRSVGDYANQIASISGLFGGAGRAAAGALQGVNSLNMGLKVMSANPVVAMFALLLPLITKVMDAMHGAEGTSQALTVAFGPLKSVGDAVTKMFQGVGKAVAGALGWIGKMLDKLGLISEQAKERQALSRSEVELQKKERESLKQTADARRQIAELNAKSVDKEKYTASERAAFLQQAIELEGDIAKREADIARQRYENIKKRNSFSESSKEELDEEAQSYADMVNAETEYYKKTKELNGRLAELHSQEQTQRQQRLSAEKTVIEQEAALAKAGSDEQYRLRLAARKKQLEADTAAKRASIKDADELNKTLSQLQRAYDKDVEKLAREHADAIAQIERQTLENRMNAYESGSAEYLALAVELRRKEMEQLYQAEGESDEAFEARRIAAGKALAKAVEAASVAEVEAGRKRLENAVNEEIAGTVQAMQAAVELAKYNLDTLEQKIGESDEDFNARRIAARQAYAKVVQELDARQQEEELLRRENAMNAEIAGSQAYLEKALELKRYELDILHQMEEESDEQFRARQLAAQKAYTDAKQSLLRQQVSDMTAYAGNVSSIMGSIADFMEQSTQADEKTQRAAKNLRIASAIIDTLSGAVTAYSQAQSLGPIAGPITGALNAAAVVAAGTANIAKIRATQVSSSNSNASASMNTANMATPAVSAPVPVYTATPTTVVNTASDEDRLNELVKDQRVYILSSDLQANSRRVAIVQQESRF